MIADKKMIQKKMEAIRVFILDMGGTICLGKNLSPYAYDSLNTMKAIEREYCFSTNNFSRGLAAYIDKLHGMGIDIDKKRMMVSIRVILRWLKKHYDGRRMYVVGTPVLCKESEAHGWIPDEEKPDIVILGFDTALVYEKLSKACTFIGEDALYYGINPDLNCPMEHDTFILDCGSTARLIEASTGKYPEFFGKPSGKTLDYIVEEAGCSPDQIVITGNRPYTDIRVADGSEVTSILILSRETKAEDTDTSDVKSDIVIEHIGELARLLQEYSKK